MKRESLRNETGIALILVLILLSILMFTVISFSRIGIESTKISQSGFSFRKNFFEFLGVNLSGIKFIYDYPIETAGFFGDDLIAYDKGSLQQNTSWEYLIKKSEFSSGMKNDIGTILYEQEKFVPGYQINAGGGHGTQSYQPLILQLYTVAKINEGMPNERKLVFRNWIQKVILKE